MSRLVDLGGGLWRICCQIGEAKPLFQHVLAGKESWCFVDTGIATTPQDYLYDFVESTWRSPAARAIAVVTHCDVDHFGGTAGLRAVLPGLVLAAHTLDAELIADRELLLERRYRRHRELGLDPPEWRLRQLGERAGPPVDVDVCLVGGELLDLGGGVRWRVLHAPGHSGGHLVLVEESGTRAVVGDAVLGWGLDDVEGRPLTPPPYADVASYLETIALLEGLPLEMLCASHFPLFEGGGAIREFLAASRAALERIGAEVTAAIAVAPRTLAELCDLVTARVGRWPAESAGDLGDPIASHLGGLVAAGRAQVLAGDPWPRFGASAPVR